MEKIVLTKKQAKDLERLKNLWEDTEVKERNLILIEEKLDAEYKWESYADEIDDADFIAVLHGETYEVEPEFSVKDYVVTNRKKVVEILEFDSINHTFTVGWIANGKMYKETISKNSVERYATDEEVWWVSHGRKPWELSLHDVLTPKNNSELLEVKQIKNEGFLIGRWNNYESVEFIKNHYRVVCFAESRLDVKTNG